GCALHAAGHDRGDRGRAGSRARGLLPDRRNPGGHRVEPEGLDRAAEDQEVHRAAAAARRLKQRPPAVRGGVTNLRHAAFAFPTGTQASVSASGTGASGWVTSSEASTSHAACTASWFSTTSPRWTFAWRGGLP